MKIIIKLVLLSVAIVLCNAMPYKEITDDLIEDNIVEIQSTNLQDDFICKEPIYDCNNNGVCLPPIDGGNSTSCLCNDRYATHKPKDNTQCNYRRKTQLTAFLLELFLGKVGAGHWYTERYDFAIPALVLFLLICCCCGSKDEDGKRGGGCIALALFALWLHGIIVYGINNLKDGNGVELYTW